MCFLRGNRPWLDGYVAVTNDRYTNLFDKLMNIVAEFKEFKVDLDNKKCQGATKTTSLKHVEVKASVPNPNLISNISSQLLISEISISWLTFLAHKKTRSPWDFLPSGVCGPQLDSRVTCQLPSRFTRGENFKRIAYKIHCSLNEQNSLVQCLNDLQISCKWPLHPTENFTSAKVNPAMSVSLYVRMNAVISKTV